MSPTSGSPVSHEVHESIKDYFKNESNPQVKIKETAEKVGELTAEMLTQAMSGDGSALFHANIINAETKDVTGWVSKELMGKGNVSDVQHRVVYDGIGGFPGIVCKLEIELK